VRVIYLFIFLLKIGGIDEDVASQYSQQTPEETIIYYTPIVEKSYYAVKLTDFSIGNSKSFV
jgi:hypothetical protein